MVTHVSVFQVDALERDAFEVLRLIRSIKNSIAPINRIPPEVLSLIPDNYNEEKMDKDLIALTHVCRSWRDIFISRPSLWTEFCCRDVDKTRTYIKRSQSCLLKMNIYFGSCDMPVDEAFALVTSHIPRLKSLSLLGYIPKSFIENFHCRTPLLEKLDIHEFSERALDCTLFGEELPSSLRELYLAGSIIGFPWKHLANLRVVDLSSHSPQYTVIQLLDFFKSAPCLHTVIIRLSIKNSSDVPPDRIVPLPHLKIFTIDTRLPHSTLLCHLHIPIGASVVSKFRFPAKDFPLLDYLPERPNNFSNLSHITTINLLFGVREKYARLDGPSGSFRVVAECNDRLLPPSYTVDRRTLRSLDHPMFSAIQRLVISKYAHERPAEVEDCPIFRTLRFTNDLRMLILIDCNYGPFILALDPKQNTSNLVLCSSMEKLVLYISSHSRDQYHVMHLISMAKHRASTGAKLSSIMIFGPAGLTLDTEISKLREYVTHVEYQVELTCPAWDDVPGESDT